MCRVDFRDWKANVLKVCFLNTPLHYPSSAEIVLIDQFAADDWRTDGFRGIDDLLDTWDTLGYAHPSNTCKMERLESHLRARFADRLRANSTDSMTRFDLGLFVFGQAELHKGFKCGSRELRSMIGPLYVYLCEASAIVLPLFEA